MSRHTLILIHPYEYITLSTNLTLIGNLDPMEGNPMWKYIQNSVSSQTPKQLQTKVTYNKDLFFDVTEEATHKLMVTHDGYSVFYIRKWAPVWPKDEDLTPDFGYGE